MKNPSLWYVRREGRLHGPHPRQAVVDSLLLGRFAWDDPASRDGRTWQPLKMHPEILSAIEPLAHERLPVPGEPLPLSWHNERLAAARRWADERTGIDRRTGEASPPAGTTDGNTERRMNSDRRQQRELLQVVLWRRLRRNLAGAYERAGSPSWALVPLGIVVMLAIGIAVSPRGPGPIEVSLTSRAADCTEPPAPGINWSGCDRTSARLAGASLRSARLAGARLTGADLSRADLSYADLSGSALSGARLAGARLFGASLTGADLSTAGLEGAELGFADLRNARLDGARLQQARLGNAIWTDGRRCAPASVGRCD
jgi:hypothetical protein